MAYYFNLPILTDLTIEQQAALAEPAALALSGSPGTGKSVVCLWRHIRNHATGSKSSLLLTYTKTLEHYLIQCAAKNNIDSSRHINRTQQWTSNQASSYDEILVDEGQDTPKEQYKIIETNTASICYTADDAQKLYSVGCSLYDLNQLFPKNKKFTLYQNFRNSREILEFIRSVFPDILILPSTMDRAKVTKVKPRIKISGTHQSQINDIISIINAYASDTHNIGVLLPLQDDVDQYYEAIKDSVTVECSKYVSRENRFETLNNVHVTTFTSAKGIEFDTVIIPNFDSMENNMIRLNAATKEHYYVAFTRARTNLFLTCNQHPNIRDTNTFEIE